VDFTPATTVNPLATDIKPASNRRRKLNKERKNMLLVAGLKQIPRRAIRVGDIAKRLMGAIISNVLGAREGVELNGVGFVEPSMMILDGKVILLIRRLASIMLEGWER
jgi:hypothetical protein